MAYAVKTTPAEHTVPGRTIRTVGVHLMRYGLVLVVAWIGAMKFTAYEANGIQPLVANSPFMGWVYHVLSIQAFSNVLGAVELAIALTIATAVGRSGGGWERGSGGDVPHNSELSRVNPRLGAKPRGFPGLSVAPGQFLLKDVVLLGAALWPLGEALQGIERARAGVPLRHGAEPLRPDADARACATLRATLNFFRSEDHVRAWWKGRPEVQGPAVTVADAFGLGRWILGDLVP